MAAPLEGMSVLDLTRLLPGGYATFLLAMLGADVIKVEAPAVGDYIRAMPPFAGGVSAAHVALNRNKRSVTLNLKAEEGRVLLRRLAEAADVLVESFRPGVMDRIGVGYGDLSARNPRLVYCALTGFGRDGPRASEAGHDINYMGYAGALSISGPEGGPPVPPGVQVADLGGAMTAVVAILAALNRRAASGAGAFCDVAMTETVLSWLSIHTAALGATGEVPRPGTMPLTGAFPCYRVYPAADGHLAVGALEPPFWRALCERLERPDLVDDAFATGARRAEVIADLSSLFSSRTRAEWTEVFAGADTCVSPVHDLSEALVDPQLVAREAVVQAPAGDARVAVPRDPLRISDAPAVEMRPAPRLGEHTDEVLRALGLDVREIARLRAGGVL